MTLPILLAASLICASLAGPAFADPCEAPLPRRGEVFAGEVRHVIDGDGLCVAVGNHPEFPDSWVEVRVADFFAPELNEPGGREAKATLARLVMGQRITCVADHKSWDRIVARCSLGGASVGDLMRRAGVREGGRR